MPVDRSLTKAPNATGPNALKAALSDSGVASNGTFRMKTVLPSSTSDLAGRFFSMSDQKRVGSACMQNKSAAKVGVFHVLQ